MKEALNAISKEEKRKRLRQSVVEIIVRQLSYSIKTLEEGRDNAKEMAINADGPWQATYDTTKKEQSWLANALHERIQRKQEDLKVFLRKLEENKGKLEKGKTLVVGSIFKIESSEEDLAEVFMLVSRGLGGEQIQLEGSAITTISTESKLGKSAYGKEKGEQISFSVSNHQSVFKIKEIL